MVDDLRDALLGEPCKPLANLAAGAADGEALQQFMGTGIPGGGDLLSSNNLGDVANDAASLANLGGLSTRGSQTFNSSGTFTTPANSTTSTVYRYRMVGGGGAGGYGSTASSSPGGGGGGANVTTTAAGSGGTAGAITGSPNILSIAGRAGGPRIGGTSGSAGGGGNGAGSILEHFPTGMNRLGFPKRRESDSSWMLAREVSMHDQGAFR